MDTGATRGGGVLFCSDTVLLEAGEPIYFIVPPGAPTRYKIMAGTSSLNRNLNSGCRLAGPSLSAALDSARKGLAFGREEIGDGISRLWDRKNDGYVSRTAPLVERYRLREAADAAQVRKIKPPGGIEPPSRTRQNGDQPNPLEPSIRFLRPTARVRIFKL
jgi:hypothetical protein